MAYLGLSNEGQFILNNLVSVEESILFSDVYFRYIREIQEVEHYETRKRKQHLNLIHENLMRQIKVVSGNDMDGYTDDEKKAVGLLLDEARSLLVQVGNKLRAIDDLSYLSDSKAGRKRSKTSVKICDLRMSAKVKERFMSEVNKVKHSNNNQGYRYAEIVAAVTKKPDRICQNTKIEVASAIISYLGDDRLTLDTLTTTHNTRKDEVDKIYNRISDKSKKTDEK